MLPETNIDLDPSQQAALHKRVQTRNRIDIRVELTKNLWKSCAFFKFLFEFSLVNFLSTIFVEIFKN